MFSNSSRIRRKRKFYYIIFFGVCVGGFKNFFGFLEIWCEMLGLEGSGGADAAQSVFTNYVKSADTAQPVPTSIYCIHEKASCRNEIISEPLPHKADPTEHSWRGVLWCCRDRLCRVRWFYVKAHPVGNVPPERFQNIGSVNGTQGGAVLFAPPSKSCRFSHPPSPCAQKHGHGEFRCLRTATQEAPRLLRTSRQLRSAGAAFSGTVSQNYFVSARWFFL